MEEFQKKNTDKDGGFYIAYWTDRVKNEENAKNKVPEEEDFYKFILEIKD